MFVLTSCQRLSIAIFRMENTSIDNNLNWNLTYRETQLLKLIAAGYKNKEIADSLCISVKTVETHRATLMKKFNAHNVAALLSVANQARINFILTELVKEL